MKLDNFAFFNQQLAGLLRTGVPLEGALRELVRDMRGGGTRRELELLAQDLERGTPLPEAGSKRKLPRLYTELLNIGARAGNLPAVLTLVADYYQHLAQAWVRLKSLLVYPLIVLVLSLSLSLFLAALLGRIMQEADALLGPNPHMSNVPGLLLMAWLPVFLLGVAVMAAIAALFVPRWRRALWWRVPPFRDAALAQLAGSFALLLEQGCSFRDSLSLIRDLEAGSPMGRELNQWHSRLASGQSKMTQLIAGSRLVPPLVGWVVDGSGADWASGFKQLAEFFRRRATSRIDLVLYAVLPVAVVLLGILIVGQVVPIAQVFLKFMHGVTDVTDVDVMQ